MHIPVNRWTVGAAFLLTLVFGSDFVAPILKAVAIMSSPHLPAI
jgi:hypothetical protein